MTQSISAAEVKAAGGYEKWLRQAGADKPRPAHVAKEPVDSRIEKYLLSEDQKARQARGRKPADPLLGYDADRMNGLEARYAGRLEAMKRAGKLVCWKFEEIKLRLACGTFYTPDFFLMLPDGSVGFHETKGFWRDDARAKIKIAAGLYPMFFFVAVRWEAKARAWSFERFGTDKSPAEAGRG